MAANRQQGTYLTAFIVAFVAVTAGLISLAYHRAFLGAVLTIGALLVLVYSLLGLRRIKPLEFTK
ncbi:MAG TPA: hypothetical protein VMT20_27845 [Terriglobia bacterium]|nr:hypothetical protein [Terriglobia bacterium]